MSFLSDASLVMIPSGYKDGTLYSAKPTNGDGDFTFSRGSNLAATRVNSDGLIEKGRENLLTYSNDFNNWTNFNTTDTSGQSGYDDSNDAWLLEALTTGSGRRIQKSVTASGVNTFSVYAKAGNVDWMAATSPSVGAYFDLANGVMGSAIGSIIDSNIASVGGGWYRCSFTANTTFSEIQIYVASADNNVSVTAGDNIYIQDAQLEQGLVATDYIETTTTTEQAGILEDMPRLDYSGGATCPSLLLEPQRSNFVTQSEYFGDADWNTATSRSYNLTYTDELNPMGIAGSYQYESTDTDNQLAYVNFGVVSGTTYTNSIYVKRVSGTGNVLLRDVNNSPTSFSLSVADGWKRIDVTGTASSTTGRFYLNLNNVGEEILVWGAQQEEGSYPTSYIPTYGASVTRGADSCSKTGISSLIGQTEGTLYSEFIVNGFTDFGTPLCINNGSTSESVWLTTFANGDIRAEVFSNAGGGIQASFLKSGNVTDQVYKIGCAYAQNDFVFYVNGVQIGSDTSGSVPTGMNRIDFDYANPTLFTKSALDIKQALLFKTRLSNDELATLTTI